MVPSPYFRVSVLAIVVVLFYSPAASESTTTSSTAGEDRLSIVGYSPEDLSSDNRLLDLFESWASKHGKRYKNLEEKLLRFENFMDNLKHIDQSNKEANKTYWLGLNEFADLSHEEFRSRYLGFRSGRFPRRKKSGDSALNFKYRNAYKIPKSMDWRKRGAVGHVKNQGPCGKYICYLETQ